MTYYEEYLAHKAHAQTWRELWHQPLDTAVRQVDTQRPTKNGLVAVQGPFSRVVYPQQLVRLQIKAARIKQEAEQANQCKDRGS